MAFSSNADSKKFILILLVSFLAFHVFITSKADLIDNVCSQVTEDVKFCKTAFQSDPRSASADLSTLARIAIDLAKSNTKSSISLVKSLEAGVTDPRVKGMYKTCLENYSSADDNLQECVVALKNQDYMSLNLHASAALDGPDTCNDEFTEPEPEELKQAGQKVETLASAICYISNALRGN